MSNKRLKISANQQAWNELDDGPKLVVAHTILNHRNYLRMSWTARSLIWDLGAQYKGNNNGFISATPREMKERNWSSPETLQHALLELEHYGFIVRTQQGGRDHRPNLYALTWRRINRRDGIELLTPDSAYLRPLGTWKEEKPDFVKPKRKATTSDEDAVKKAA